MEVSHVISDSILCLTAFFVFFRFLSRLELIETLLWESFVLSVAVAALFGTMRYAGVERADYLSIFFQHLAVTVGGMGLVTCTWAIALNKRPNKNFVYAVIGFGFALFAVSEAFNFSEITRFMPLVSMPLVAIAALWALLKGKTAFGVLVLLAIGLLALAVFREKFIPNQNDAIDAYHYLLAAAIVLLGIAAIQEGTIGVEER